MGVPTRPLRPELREEIPARRAPAPPVAAVMVVGGGIGGMRAALDLADAGLRVFLIERTPGLGGRVAQLGYMFPQHDCVLCRGTPDHGYGCTRPSISPAYIQHNQHPNIEILTNTRIVGVAGQAGDFTVSLRQEPRHVDIERCINCGRCAEVCPIDLPDDYQQGMTTRKAAYKVSARATPDAYVIDRGSYCDDCRACVPACPSGAIDLDAPPRLMTVEVGAIILALGFQAYDPTELEELGYGRYPNVLSALQYERLASRSGPSEGVVTRPSDGHPPRSIAWLQCVGSRDQQTTYCSSICCMYATKEAMLAKQRLGGDVACSLFIMDERAFNKQYAAYFTTAREQYGIRYLRCRVSDVHEDPSTRDLVLRYPAPDGQMREERFDMVVLATGLQPPDAAGQLAEMLGIRLNAHGFCETDKFAPLQTSRPGVFVCGSFAAPKEIAETILDASGAAAEAMRLLNEQLGSYPVNREWPFLTSNGQTPERDVAADPPRVGLFACACGSTISRSIDLPALTREAASWPGVAHAETLDFACFPEALDHIGATIASADLNRVVIAACSNRTHDPVFQRTAHRAGLNPYLVELVNVRDQCSRVHARQPTLANRKAKELVRIGVARACAAQPVHKQPNERRPAALVIGAGVAGMTSALAIADCGHPVHLVERSPVLGGNLATLYYVAEGYDPQLLLRDLVNRVRAHRNITVHTRTEVVAHSGHTGNFRADLRRQNADGSVDEVRLEHGATVVAVGGQETREHPLLDLPGVITQRELEQIIIHRPAEIAALRDVVMIQCVRPPGLAEYCSRVCCTNTIKNAIRIRLFNPACRVTVLYKNIVTYGFREAFYTEARRLGVVFTRYTDAEPPEVTTEGGRLAVRLHDLILDRPVVLPADLVPLSMAIAPSSGIGDLAKVLRVPLTSEGFFEDAQLKLRPMDFMREGIFLAGMAHYPKFIEESISQALAAAARAITLLAQDTLHLGGVVAVVDPEKCVGCLTCTRTCPFGIPQVIAQPDRPGVGGLGGAAYIDPAQCQGCGTCTGECPASAIQLANYTDVQMTLPAAGGLGRWLPGLAAAAEAGPMGGVVTGAVH